MPDPDDHESIRPAEHSIVAARSNEFELSETPVKPVEALSADSHGPGSLEERERKLEESRQKLRDAKSRLRTEYESFVQKRKMAQEILDQRIKENESRLNQSARWLRRRKRRLQAFRNGLKERHLEDTAARRAVGYQPDLSLETLQAEHEAEIREREAQITQLEDQLTRQQRLIDDYVQQLEQQRSAIEAEPGADEDRAQALVRELAHKNEELAAQQHVIAEQHRQIDELRHSEAKLRHEREELSAEIHALGREGETALAEMQQQFEERLREYQADQEEQARQLNERQRELEEQITAEQRLREAHESLQQQIESANEDANQTIERLRQKLAEQEERFQQRIREQQEALDAQSSASTELESLRQQHQQAVERIESLQGQQAQSEEARETLATELAAAQQELEQVRQSVRQAEQERRQWDQQRRQLEDDLEQARQGRQELDEQIATLTTEQEASQQELAEAARLRDEAQAAADEAREELTALQQETEQLRADLAARDEADQSSSAEQAGAVTSLQSAHQQELEALRREHAAAIADLENELTELRTQLGEQEATLAARADELTVRDGRIAELETQISTVEGERDAARSERDEINGLLENAESSHAQAIEELHRSLAELREAGEASRDTLREELENAQRQRDELQQSCDELRAQLAEPAEAEPSDRGEALAGELKERDKLIGDYASKIEELKETIAERESQLDDLKQQQQHLRQLNADLQTDVERLTWQQGDAFVQLEEEVRQKDKQATQYLSAMRAREEQLHKALERERDLKAELEQLAEQRDEALEAQQRDRQEVEQHRREIYALHQRLDQYREAAGEDGVAFDELPIAEPGPDELEDRPPAGAPIVTPAPVLDWSAALRSALPVGLIALLLTAGGLLGWAFWSYQPRFAVTGAIVAAPGDEARLATCDELIWSSELLPTNRTWRTERVPDRPILRLGMEASDAQASIDAINQLGQQIVGQVNERITTQPGRANDPQGREQLSAQLERVSAELGKLPADGHEGDRVADVLASLAGAQKEQQEIAATLRDLSTHLTDHEPSEEELVIAPDRVAQAEHAVEQIQADLEALAHRQGRLATLMKELLSPGEQRFRVFADRLPGSKTLLANALQETDEEDAQQAVRQLQNCLTRWAQATDRLQEVWLQHWAELQTASDGFDPLPTQATMEKAARQYLEQTTPALALFEQALASLPEQGEQPTKRIVLHRRLTQRLQPILNARHAVALGARSVIPDNNPQLEAVVQTVRSIRERVDRQREAIEADLRQQMLADLRERHREEIAQARIQRDRLLQRSAQLDVVIRERTAEALKAVAQRREVDQAIRDRVTLHQRQGELLSRLIRIEANEAEAARRQLRYVPAQVVRISETWDQHLLSTLTIGLVPLIASFMLGTLFWWLVVTRRNARELEAFAAQLQAADQRDRYPDGSG